MPDLTLPPPGTATGCWKAWPAWWLKATRTPPLPGTSCEAAASRRTSMSISAIQGRPPDGAVRVAAEATNARRSRARRHRPGAQLRRPRSSRRWRRTLAAWRSTRRCCGTAVHRLILRIGAPGLSGAPAHECRNCRLHAGQWINAASAGAVISPCHGHAAVVEVARTSWCCWRMAEDDRLDSLHVRGRARERTGAGGDGGGSHSHGARRRGTRSKTNGRFPVVVGSTQAPVWWLNVAPSPRNPAQPQGNHPHAEPETDSLTTSTSTKPRVPTRSSDAAQGGGGWDYTWRQMMDQARRMARRTWRGRGFEPGARIAIPSKNTAHFMMAELAI